MLGTPPRRPLRPACSRSCFGDYNKLCNAICSTTYTLYLCDKKLLTFFSLNSLRESKSDCFFLVCCFFGSIEVSRELYKSI